MRDEAREIHLNRPSDRWLRLRSGERGAGSPGWSSPFSEHGSDSKRRKSRVSRILLTRGGVAAVDRITTIGALSLRDFVYTN